MCYSMLDDLWCTKVRLYVEGMIWETISLCYGIMEVVPNKPFHTLVENISIRPIHKPERMYMEAASPPPAHVVLLYFEQPRTSLEEERQARNQTEQLEYCQHRTN